MTRPGQGAKETGYAERKVAETQAGAQTKVAAIEAAGGVVRELVSAAKSNPIIGCAVALIVADVLASARVITARTEAFIFIMVGTAFGVTVALEVLDTGAAIASSVNPFSGGGATAPDPSELIRPSAQTVVENPPAIKSADQGVGLGAIASRLLPKEGVLG